MGHAMDQMWVRHTEFRQGKLIENQRIQKLHNLMTLKIACTSKREPMKIEAWKAYQTDKVEYGSDVLLHLTLIIY